jgi:hypothetical protein
VNYKIVQDLLHPKDSEKNCPIFKVLETKTDLILGTFQDPKDAKQLLRHLNLGGGFDGWTPSFILKTIKFKN